MPLAAFTPSLTGRQLYLPRMSDCGAELLAAAFRSAGLDATVLPAPDARTLELGARYLTGEECLPAKVTLGDVLKLVETPGFRPEKVALFMPGSEGPCRLGQYGPQIRNILRRLGYPDVLLMSPTDGDGYRQAGALAPHLMRTAWRAMVSSDLVRKLLLKTRPYECVAGDADQTYAAALRRLCNTLEIAERSPRAQLRRLLDILTGIRDRFRAVRAYDRAGRLLIGIQGELFCRMEDFSNGYLIRRLETCGAEAWLSDLSEWIWYSNSEEEQRLRHLGRRCSRAMMRAKLRDHVQRSDQRALHAPFAEDLWGYEEPENTKAILRAGHEYLPFTCTEGEMVLSAGKVEHFFRHGVDGIIDVSPFSCMNGIVSEALYPRVSRDHAGVPIKSVYVDGTGKDLTADLEIFLELARAYRRNKPHSRLHPASSHERLPVSARAEAALLAPTFPRAS